MSAESVRAARDRVAALPEWKRALYALEEKALLERDAFWESIRPRPDADV